MDKSDAICIWEDLVIVRRYFSQLDWYISFSDIFIRSGTTSNIPGHTSSPEYIPWIEIGK